MSRGAAVLISTLLSFRRAMSFSVFFFLFIFEGKGSVVVHLKVSPDLEREVRNNEVVWLVVYLCICCSRLSDIVKNGIRRFPQRGSEVGERREPNLPDKQEGKITTALQAAVRKIPCHSKLQHLFVLRGGGKRGAGKR